MHEHSSFWNDSGFTLIELLIVIVVISALAVTVFVALNPVKRLEDARDARRTADVDTILTGIHEYIVDNSGSPPSPLPATGPYAETQLGTCVAGAAPAISTGGCSIAAGKACIDLSSSLANYIKTIPTDPKSGTAAQTLYSVTMDANNIITVRACGVEDTSSISDSR